MTKDRLGKLPKLGVPKCSFSHSFGFWACLAVPAEQSFSGNVWSKEESLSFNSSAPCELGKEGFVRDKQTLRGSACKWNFKLLPREEKHSRRLLEMQEVTTQKSPLLGHRFCSVLLLPLFFLLSHILVTPSPTGAVPSQFLHGADFAPGGKILKSLSTLNSIELSRTNCAKGLVGKPETGQKLNLAWTGHNHPLLCQKIKELLSIIVQHCGIKWVHFAVLVVYDNAGVKKRLNLGPR